MARTMAQIVTMIQDSLREDTEDDFTAAKVRAKIPQGLRDLSLLSPRIVSIELDVEARTGTATSTSAGNLVDATNAHFVAGDVGKMVYNTTDKTWAQIKTYTSTTTVALTADIMASGEDYKLYNQDCENAKQLYIGDYANDIILACTPNRVEYYAQQDTPEYRNFKEISRTVLEILIDGELDTDYAKAWIKFAMYHKLPNLTDWAGAVNNAGGYAAGSVSMAINGLSGTETIPEGAEFKIASLYKTYRVTADVTLSGGGGTISFYPGLEVAVINAQVITFTVSTLNPLEEEVLADYVAGCLCVNIARNKYHGSGYGNEGQNLENWGEKKKDKALARLPRRMIAYEMLPTALTTEE